MSRKEYIFGNWKMNKTLSETKEFFEIAEKKLATADLNNVIMGIGVPFLNLLEAKSISKNIAIAAQNVHHEDKGAFTGEISIPMLKDAGVTYCIVGHSERREIFGETDKVINTKVIKLLRTNIIPIFCLGESELQYNNNQTTKICQQQIEKGFSSLSAEQVKKIVVAYEPIWAIGTGKTATPQMAQETIKIIRNKLASMYSVQIADAISILYGGSVKPGNIKEIMAQPDIDGVLVGGASISIDSYIDLYNKK